MKTLQEQQAEAWRLAPDDAEWICQNRYGKWVSHKTKPVPVQNGYASGEMYRLLKANINGWDWRDTLQSREEFEEMQSSELDKTNSDHKEDFVPEIGDTVRFNWKRQEEEFWQLNQYKQGKIDYITTGGVVIDDCFFDYATDTVDIQQVKPEAEKRREEQIEKISNYLASLSDNHLTPKSDFVFKRIQDLESETMRMSYNDGPAKGVIRDLYRVVDHDDGAECLAVALYNAGCRMTRELTDEVASKLWFETNHHRETVGNHIPAYSFADAIAAYVTGSGEYE